MKDTIENIGVHYDGICVEAYVIMPNHVHMILAIVRDDNGRMISSPTVSTVIGQMKRFCSKQIGHTIWQKSFHDHIIRNEKEHLKLLEYIETNSLKWELGCYYAKDI